MNIRRYPLNGRNFEYFSEDPLLTGKVAAAQLKSLHERGVTGEIKHFAANNQEHRRFYVEAVVSERALREIYLRGFEIAVKEGGAFMLMSSYNPLNAYWTSSNYDLMTTILRDEWGFDGAVTTDWWAMGNDLGQDGSRTNMASMIRAQNDIYMVCTDSLRNSNGDNSARALAEGKVTIAEYQRSAKNILSAIMRLAVFKLNIGIEDELFAQLEALPIDDDTSFDERATEAFDFDSRLDFDPKLFMSGGATRFLRINAKTPGTYELTLTLKSTTDSDIAQLPYSVFVNGKHAGTVLLSGFERQAKDVSFTFETKSKAFTLSYYMLGGMEVMACVLKLL